MVSKEQFKEIMELTHYGWKASGDFAHIGCPSDVEGVKESDEPHKGCFMECEDCWKYVLKNKKWEA